jgi:hypothetical protein
MKLRIQPHAGDGPRAPIKMGSAEKERYHSRNAGRGVFASQEAGYRPCRSTKRVVGWCQAVPWRSGPRAEDKWDMGRTMCICR